MLSFRDSKTVEFCVSNECLTFGSCGGVCLGVEEPVIPGPVISQPESVGKRPKWASTNAGPGDLGVHRGPLEQRRHCGAFRLGCRGLDGVCVGGVFDQVLMDLGIFPGQRAPRFPLAWEGGQEGAMNAGEEETLGHGAVPLRGAFEYDHVL